MPKLIFICVILLFFSFPVYTLKINLKKYTLKNNLNIIINEMPYVDTVSIVAFIKVGSCYETPQEAGLSHFLEHMLFKGTTRRTSTDIYKQIEGVGGEINAKTSKEYTFLYTILPAEAFDIGIEIISDILQNSVFPEEEIERERKVILEEIKAAEDRPVSKCFKLFFLNIYKNHPLAHPILGTKETVNRLTRESLLSFYKRYYVPNNIILSIAGNVKPKRAIRKIKQLWENIPQQHITHPVYQRITAQGNHWTEYADIMQAHIAYGILINDFTEKERYALNLIATLLGEGGSSRLFIEIREKRGLAYAIFADIMFFQNNHALFIVYAGIDKKNYQEVVKIINEKIKELQVDKIKEEELQAVKNYLLGTFARQHETSYSLAYLIGYLEMTNRLEHLFRYKKNILSISKEDILNTAKKFLSPDYSNILLLSPKEEE